MLWIVAWCLLCGVCWLLVRVVLVFGVCCWLLAVYCLLFGVRWLLFFASRSLCYVCCCVLRGVCRLVFVMCCCLLFGVLRVIDCVLCVV